MLGRCLESVAKQTYPNLEVIVLDDASDPPADQVAIKRIMRGQHSVCVLRAEEQLGLNRMRNRLVEAASGDVFFFIDDDAYFEDTNAVDLIIETFNADPNRGILATKILDYRGGSVRPLTPHGRRHLKRDPDLTEKPHLISYFLGGGHAVRREVIEQCGGYDEVLMYGQDELELAYRALEQGFQIYYEPEVVIHHKPPSNPGGVKSETSWRLFYLTRNRILFAYKHLPFRYTVPYVAGWLGWYGIRAIRSGLLPAYLEGISDGFKTMRTIARNPVGDKTVAYLKRHYGRLWR